MNHYEAKQAARKERMAERAEKLRAAAHREFDKADLREEKSGIPFGQPILVGHHSERKHRNALARADTAMRRGIEAEKRADELERRAETTSNAISSDDPDALDKLDAKIAILEIRQAFMRAANTVVRKAHKAGVTPESGDDFEAYVSALRTLPNGEAVTAALAAQLIKPDFCGRIGFPDYALTNNNANIRRLKQRLASIEKAADAKTTEREVGDGVTIVENVEENRLQIMFPGKPDADRRAKLKAAGFRWSPSAGAWQRQLNNAARYAAECALR